MCIEIDQVAQCMQDSAAALLLCHAASSDWELVYGIFCVCRTPSQLDSWRLGGRLGQGCGILRSRLRSDVCRMGWRDKCSAGGKLLLHIALVVESESPKSGRDTALTHQIQLQLHHIERKGTQQLCMIWDSP